MPDKKSLVSDSQTGAVQIVKEPRALYEPPQPITLPEMPEESGATGKAAVVTEGRDRSAALDSDSGTES
jgi:hypothetical protein